MTGSDIADIVRRRLAQALGIPTDEVGPDAVLRYLPNVDSLRLLDATTAVEQELGVRVDEAELYGDVRTVADLIALFERAVR